MAVSATGAVQVNLTADLLNPLDIGSGTYAVRYTPSNVFGDGTGANQIKEIFTDTRTLSASASENLDLAGVLTDVFGTVLSFVKIKAICITADPGNTNDVIIGNHATAAALLGFGAAAHTWAIKPGGMFLTTAPDANGYPVTATTADMIKVLNSAGGTSVTYTICIMGTV
jgi:hypothetical protein